MASYLQPELPAIAMTSEDAERLGRLANAAAHKFPRTADFLGREVERARVLSGTDVLPGLVRMGSTVAFRDDVTGQVREAMLVYPDVADVAAGKISVLTPIGAALIGLSVSQSIEFQTPSGGWRSLTVLAVQDPQTS